MKKILSILLCAVIAAGVSACAGNTDGEEYASNPGGESRPEKTESRTIKGFDGKITKKWDSVKSDYERLEEEAQKELDEEEKVTRESVNGLVDEIDEGLKKLKDGITDDNEETAKKVYKDAHKLKLLAKRGSSDVTRELERIADSSKAMVRQYYGVADDDYDTVGETVDTAIKKVRNFTDDIWDAFVKLFE